MLDQIRNLSFEIISANIFKGHGFPVDEMFIHAFLSARQREFMMMSYNETRVLVESVLAIPVGNARKDLHIILRGMTRSEPEFCTAVIAYHQRLLLSSERWLDLFIKIPNRAFFDEPKLMDKLSPRQRDQLFTGNRME